MKTHSFVALNIAINLTDMENNLMPFEGKRLERYGTMNNCIFPL